MNYNDVVSFWRKKNISTEAELSAILDSYSVNFAYNSGKIENDNITYRDTREIFDKNGVTSYTGDLRTLYEIQNAKAAHELILKSFREKQKVTEQFIKEVQKTLTIGTYDERRYEIGERPGQYKRNEYIVGKHETGALPEDVAEEMQELLEELDDIDGIDILTVAAYFHAKFENIHPFSDGNGRAGRLIMNYILVSNNHPPITIFEEDRRQYYAALEQFDSQLELTPLIEFLTAQLIKTWEPSITKERKSRCVSLNDVLQTATDRATVLNTQTEPHSTHEGPTK